MAGLLDIGEVAARSGMAASTLRYYERQGIIASDDRKGLRRQYQPEVLDILAMVALCQRAGFNLAEIKALLATGGDVEWKVLAASKRDELRGKARHLVLLADQIDHALGCRSANAFDCEHFQAALLQALPVERPARSPAAKPRKA
jgi:DNA-binding transcriptional MerR regulator